MADDDNLRLGFPSAKDGLDVLPPGGGVAPFFLAARLPLNGGGGGGRRRRRSSLSLDDDTAPSLPAAVAWLQATMARPLYATLEQG
ncbi:hypothetical protein GUJ93_ZPchr0010g9895 [Zizania palustris]|uniref:Uncharacterized protein n=1 Tax=Zizania palustris TaxID=103762 RepID=A0A8J5WCW4_ZIZPA|nr:hypothetical protein GUJ93_ZPchr0010g9895 [Zizania palustris]